ncbi:MAG: DUF3231 family protein [Thermincola sp.]|jgi:spore coat protein CotF|nr:DUF3231 family protein [Thermincola sp.]MDT3703274.1 DUF3231 family protein [Thermincola sp.]
MVFSFTLNKKAEKKQSLLNCEEAYNLWDLATAKAAAINQMEIWQTYAHDPELKLIIGRRLEKNKDHFKSLEDELKKFSIGGPKGPIQGISVSTNSEVLLDEDLANQLLIWLQANVEQLYRAFRTSTTNDSIRALFVKFMTDTIDDLDIFIKYMKLKGWTDIPPMYQNIPAETTEKLDAGEAFHLWDHLTFRYDNIEQTQFWYEYVYDADFKFLLKTGLQETLQKQATKLEKELLKFGIPLPKPPSGAVEASSNTNIRKDSDMFRLLFTGIVGAAWLHALALKQCITNDRIRGIFKDLLVQEIQMLDKLISCGKLKGWLAVVPQYKPIL